MIAAADCAIRRWLIAGEVYTPVVCGGVALGPDDVAALAATPAPAGPVRRLALVLGDEALPRSGPPPLDLRRVRLPGVSLPPLEFADLGIGRLERLWIAPADRLEGLTGRALGAVAQLDATALADIVWRAVRSGTLAGVSIRAHQFVGETVLLAVRLGDRGESCLASARVVSAWEGAAVEPEAPAPAEGP